ncbi:MAG: PPC domain-containing protein [Spirulinaceae cyanobacterium]
MTKSSNLSWYSTLLMGTVFLTLGISIKPTQAQSSYAPIPIPQSNEISDRLSESDIPTGDGGFFRDYLVNLQKGDQVAIDLLSEEFDTVITLIADDGSAVGENDDGPDGSTNSLLFSRIAETGKYVVRVKAFGETGGGTFSLKVTRLRPTGGAATCDCE